MLTRAEVYKLVQENCSERLQLHCREAEVIMRKVAAELHEDVEQWGITGLIHDLDFEKPETQKDFTKHGILIQEIVGKEKLPAEIWHAITSHNWDNTGVKKETKLDYALAACENMGGFIYAVALIYPDKKVASVKPKSITKRLKISGFARNVNREAIYGIEKAELTLDRFVEISLQAMQEIAPEIGL